MNTDERIQNKLVLARRAVRTEDYAGALKAYRYVLEKDPSDAEAMFYVPYCTLLRKRKPDYVSDCGSFNKNLRVVFETLGESDMPAEEKDELCTRFVTDTQKMCKMLDERIEDTEIPDRGPDDFSSLDRINWYNAVEKIRASVCVYAVNGEHFDLTGCRHVLLELLDGSLKHYGWTADNGVSNTLRQVRDMLLRKMEERGDDVSVETELDRSVKEEIHDRETERKVIERLKELMVQVSGQ